ncbi:MAG: hypothetical protein A2132_05315 [Nitrospirae bacterium RBG_16_43_11]|nr:MAG: hypothetical protein A2132_05315 [Nitrospirae bacterium RBG_16_43_11]
MKRPALSDYDIWMNNFAFTEKKRNHVLSEIERFSYKPLISIATPVYNIEDVWLEKCIQSVLAQTYANWELCIVDDASTRKGIREVLQRYSKSDSRIKTKYLTQNLHISGATNEALDMAGGEFVAFLDHDDELHPNALYEIVNLLQSSKDADIIYTDNDMIKTEGKRFGPKFKPDWSPELLLSYMYISHLFVCRTALVREVGGLRKGYEGSQDHDLALRLSEMTDRIYHIPKILYHARLMPTSVSRSGDSKPHAIACGIKAVQDAVIRRGFRATVDRPDFAIKAKYGNYKLNFHDSGNERVAIIIPTRDRVDLLKRCIDSIEAKTTYKNYEIIIVDDRSQEEATHRYFNSIRHRVIKAGYGVEFNFSRIINRAVRESGDDIEYLLFLNNDTEVITDNWIEEMLGWMQSPEIGAVGAKLLYSDNTIQHAGIILALHEGLPGHAFKTLPESSIGYLSLANVARNSSAVTAACMLTRRSSFEEVGGFDEEDLSEAYNDVDYCLKLREKGYRIVFTPYAILYHYEGRSRGRRVPVNNEHAFRKKWGNIRVDPYFNPNLEGWLFRVRKDVREVLPVSRKIKILLVSHNFNYEGAPLSLLSIAKGLHKDGYEISVLSPKDGVLKDAYIENGMEVIVRDIRLAGVSVAAFYEEINKLAAWVSESGFDIIFCNTLNIFYAHYVAQSCGIPSIWCIRESAIAASLLKRYFENDALVKLGIEAAEIPTHLIFVSKETARLFGDPENNGAFRIIHNGIGIEEIEKYKMTYTKNRLRKEYGIPDGVRVITLVGTTNRRKAQDVFIRSAVELLKKDNKLLFNIVGGREEEVEYLGMLRKMISDAGVGKYIRIIPETPHVFPYYRISDIFVCASYAESFPRVILEAMLFKLPIVATKVYGIQEQIEDGISGLLVPPGDHNILSEKIALLLADESLTLGLAENAYYRVINKFTYDNMMESYKRCINESIFSLPNYHGFTISDERSPLLLKKLSYSVNQYRHALERDGVYEGNKKTMKKLCKKLYGLFSACYEEDKN